MNLARFGLSRPELLIGDAFELVPSGALADTRAGVWYYDAAHSYEAQLDGLRIAEPLLAPGALVIVNDTRLGRRRSCDGRLSRRATASAANSHDRRKSRGAPQWWEGMQVLAGTAEARLSAADRQPAVEHDPVLALFIAKVAV